MITKSFKNDIKSVLAGIYAIFAPFLDRDQSIPILCYHSVNHKRNIESDPLHPDLFDAHLNYLSRNHNVIHLKELVQALLSTKPLPANSVVITFDDGYIDNFEVAYPILQKYSCPVTFFVVTGFIENEVDLNGYSGWESMTWDNLKQLDKSPLVTIGAHSHSHPILSSITPDKIVYELVTSLQILRNKLGHHIEFFAYPYGQLHHIPKNAKHILEELSVMSALSTCWRSSNSRDNLFALNRIMINGDDSLEVFKKELAGSYDYIYYIQLVKSYLFNLFHYG